ncbi:hypothetical protein Scep_005101 [Stephania cephalantha]|uniref:Uncharacterized protein n=1 Tax=Stephania cephalantha TaxID=152367 RepID=A0AAP0PW14_9MAGN
MALCKRWPFTKVGRSSTWMWWSPTTREDTRQFWPCAVLYRSSVLVHWKHTEAHLRTSTPSSTGSNKTIGSDGGTMCWLPKFGARRRFEFLATPEYLPWFVKVSHPVITNPSFEDLVMVSSTIADNEILERNRRALDAALRWMDLPPEMSTFDSARTTLTDMVNLLSGRTFSPTPTSTFPATATGTTTTTGPTEQGPRHSQHGSTSSPPTQATAQPAEADAGPQKRMHGKEYRRKNMKKPKQ